jgi:hypothetical protein
MGFTLYMLKARRFLPTRKPKPGVAPSKWTPSGSVRTAMSVKRFLFNFVLKWCELI